MTTPQQAGAPAPAPPAVPVQPPPQGAAGSAGQGAFSTVLGSFVAVITYVTGALAAIPDHVATCVDGGASRPDRARAFTLLAGKLALLGLLVFAAWQEWQQHIIYATETAKAQAQKMQAEACAAAGNGPPLFGNPQAMADWEAKERARHPECFNGAAAAAATSAKIKACASATTLDLRSPPECEALFAGAKTKEAPALSSAPPPRIDDGDGSPFGWFTPRGYGLPTTLGRIAGLICLGSLAMSIILGVWAWALRRDATSQARADRLMALAKRSISVSSLTFTAAIVFLALDS
jgi:hypothetical protein